LPKKWFGPISLSIFAAFAHIAGQLIIVALVADSTCRGQLFNTYFLLQLPYFFGIINGLVTARLLAE